MSKIVIFILLYSTSSFACKIGPTSSWNLSEIELENKAENIVVAKLVDAKPVTKKLMNLKFQVIEVKKGKQKKKDDFIYIKNVEKTDSNSVTYGKACNFEFNYKLGQDYVVHVGMFNPNAIKPIAPLEK